MEFMKKGAILSKRFWEEEREKSTNIDASHLAEEDERKGLGYDHAKVYFRSFLLGLDYRKKYKYRSDWKRENERKMKKIYFFG